MAARRQVARMRRYAAEEAAAAAARPVTPVTPSGNVRTVFGTARSSMMRRVPSKSSRTGAPAPGEPLGRRNSTSRGNGFEQLVAGAGRGGARAPAAARSHNVSRRRLSGIQSPDGEAPMRSPMGTGRSVDFKSVG